MVFDSILCNIDEVLSMNPSASAFVFGDFNISTDLPILVEVIDLVIYIFSTSNEFT